MTDQGFDRWYASNSSLFGGRCEGLAAFLREYRPVPGAALDVGAGEGRNTYFLASLGWRVVAVEATEHGARAIELHSQYPGDHVSVIHGDFLSVELAAPFDLIVAVTVLEHLDASLHGLASERLCGLLRPGGYLYAVVLTQADPGFHDSQDASECAKFVKHYFASGELRDMFGQLRTVSYQEHMKRDETHGHAHMHGIAELVAMKSGVGAETTGASGTRVSAVP